MAISTEAGSWWSRCKLGLVSLALSLTEIAVVYGTVVWIVMSKQQHTPAAARTIVDFAFLLGSLSSLGFAVAGLVADSKRLPALIATVVMILTFLVCGLQMLV
jgi:hypothetical protein